MKALFCHFRLTAHLGLCEKEKNGAGITHFCATLAVEAVCACVRFLFISNTESQPMVSLQASLTVFDL